MQWNTSSSSQLPPLDLGEDFGPSLASNVPIKSTYNNGIFYHQFSDGRWEQAPAPPANNWGRSYANALSHAPPGFNSQAPSAAATGPSRPRPRPVVKDPVAPMSFDNDVVLSDEELPSLRDVLTSTKKRTASASSIPASTSSAKRTKVPAASEASAMPPPPPPKSAPTATPPALASSSSAKKGPGRKKGSKNFTAEQMETAVTIIADVKPSGQKMWERVAECYNEIAESEGWQADRNGESLKAMFDRLTKVRPPTGDPDVPEHIKKAFEAQAEIARVNEEGRLADDSEYEDSDNEVEVVSGPSKPASSSASKGKGKAVIVKTEPVEPLAGPSKKAPVPRSDSAAGSGTRTSLQKVISTVFDPDARQQRDEARHAQQADLSQTRFLQEALFRRDDEIRQLRSDESDLQRQNLKMELHVDRLEAKLESAKAERDRLDSELAAVKAERDALRAEAAHRAGSPVMMRGRYRDYDYDRAPSYRRPSPYSWDEYEHQPPRHYYGSARAPSSREPLRDVHGRSSSRGVDENLPPRQSIDCETVPASAPSVLRSPFISPAPGPSTMPPAEHNTDSGAKADGLSELAEAAARLG